MDSRLNARASLVAFVAMALSGAALYLSEGLNPQWWAMWLAPLPVMWIAPRLPWTIVAGAALGAGVIGRLSMWSYHGRLQFPLWLQVASVVMPAVAFCAGIALFRILYRRGKIWLAVLAFPSVMVAYEYLTSLGSGTFGNTAYTQLKNLPVLQIGALTGLWGIGFLVMLFPSLLAAISLSPAKMRQRLAIVLAVVFGSTLIYGVLRLSSTPSSPGTIVVGLAVSDLPKNSFPQKDPEAMQLLRDYAGQVELLAQRGAEVVVLPEMTALIPDSISGAVDELFREAARRTKVQILLGILHVTSNAAFNEARLYSESRDVVYRKHHLVPVVEGRTIPGTDTVVLREPARVVGLAICRDMDYPDPSRLYGQAQVGLLLVPAWDFDVDRLWHGHMGIMRGVENGFAVVRAAKQGLLTVSDNRGRVLSEKPTAPREAFTTMLASVPVQHATTLYQSWGDWFAWLDMAVVAGLFTVVVVKRQGASRRIPELGSEVSAPANAGKAAGLM
ncbi:MAG TPA: nitrilase-related carbon-nitrogen hydrolase [Bryobacteraceae bacterium]|nr:nitrilase-related carbon-nitrogen hydrolase [Bryobacteraceae bacterium]